MTCETANLLAQLARDLAAEDRAALDAHREACPQCRVSLARHGHQDAAIAAVMKAVTVPVGFRDALQTQAIAMQNSLWRAKWLSRGAGVLAAAAAILLGTGLVANLARPSFDSEQFLASFDASGSAALAFDDWRLAEGLPPLPDDFDLQLVTFRGREWLQGRLVPAVRLRSGREHAVVYFVRDSQYRLSGAVDAVGSEGSVRVYRGQPGGYTLIVVHTGPSLAPFLRQPGSSA